MAADMNKGIHIGACARCVCVSVGGGVVGEGKSCNHHVVVTHLLHWCVKAIIIQVAEESVIHSPTFIPAARKISGDFVLTINMLMTFKECDNATLMLRPT